MYYTMKLTLIQLCNETVYVHWQVPKCPYHMSESGPSLVVTPCARPCPSCHGSSSSSFSSTPLFCPLPLLPHHQSQWNCSHRRVLVSSWLSTQRDIYRHHSGRRSVRKRRGARDIVDQATEYLYQGDCRK
jgi:hypothetical protein